MSKTVIETYRGIDIEFDTNFEKFQCIVEDDDDGIKESKSYSAVKRFIDNYRKNNQDFKPFEVEKLPGKGNGRCMVVGLRKDNRFIVEVNGKKKQMSGYEESDYMLINKKNEPFFKELDDLYEEHTEFMKSYGLKKGLIMDKFDVVGLKEHRKEMLKNL